MKCGEVDDSKKVQSEIVNKHTRLCTQPEYCDDEVYLGVESFIEDMSNVKNRNYRPEGRTSRLTQACGVSAPHCTIDLG
jgi:hypothetical protein